MPVLGVGVASDGQMALPPDPANVGWYAYGPRPGDSAGSTVLAAHIDAPRYGIGPLARLGELRQGDVITVASSGTSRRYVVSSTRQLEKTSLDLTSIFARTGPPRLHLITCGGDFDPTKRHYEQNVVVLALPAG
jgi:sortase (surface protein transpeptidase)